MFTVALIAKILLGIFVLGVVLAAFWEDILSFVKNMLERGREAVIQSEWNAKTKRLVVKVIDKLLGRIDKEEETFVDEDEIWKMVEEGIYTEEEARRLINELKVNKGSRR